MEVDGSASSLPTHELAPLAQHTHSLPDRDKSKILATIVWSLLRLPTGQSLTHKFPVLPRLRLIPAPCFSLPHRAYLPNVLMPDRQRGKAHPISGSWARVKKTKRGPSAGVGI